MISKVCILLASLGLVACVTINIYFPAAEAQEVADEIIDDVWQLKDDDEKSDATVQPPENDSNSQQEASESK